MNKQVLLTGATGFIGTRLVEELTRRGYHVRAIVRKTSQTSHLLQLGVELATADLLQDADADAVASAVEGCDYVFHLAAETRAVDCADLVDRNSAGIKKLIDGILQQPHPARLIYISSLAAVGPSDDTRPLDETWPRKPVSWYGRSKAACEELAEAHADRIPTSIVRPPIVLGETDANGWLMFQPIDSFGVHFVPGLRRRYYSTIYVDDLCKALIAVAENGEVLPPKKDAAEFDAGQGIYFATSPEVFSFADLGRAIGRALGRKSIWAIPVAMPILWVVSLFNEIRGRITRQAPYLNRDKYCEAAAGSWWCSGEKLNRELGFEPAATMEEHLDTIVAGYRKEGWLRQPSKENQASSERDRQTSSREQSFG